MDLSSHFNNYQHSPKDVLILYFCFYFIPSSPDLPPQYLVFFIFKIKQQQQEVIMPYNLSRKVHIDLKGKNYSEVNNRKLSNVIASCIFTELLTYAVTRQGVHRLFPEAQL